MPLNKIVRSLPSHCWEHHARTRLYKLTRKSLFRNFLSFLLQNRWSNVTSTEGRSPPPPRAHHTAAVVDGGFFVAGGTGAMGALSDLWRRGNSSSPSTSKGWTLLAEGSGAQLTPTGPMKPHGASIMVSPWGVLSLGGMRQGSGVGATSDLWVLDPVSKLWRSVSCGEDGRGASPWPVGR